MEEIEIIAQSKISGEYQAIFVSLFSTKHHKGKTLLKLYDSAGKSNAEHLAIIESLKLINRPCRIKLKTDAQKFTTAFNSGAYEKWLRNGFKKPKNQQGLYKSISELLNGHNVTVEYLHVTGRDIMGDDELKKVLKYKNVEYINGVLATYRKP